ASATLQPYILSLHDALPILGGFFNALAAYRPVMYSSACIKPNFMIAKRGSFAPLQVSLKSLDGCMVFGSNILKGNQRSFIRRIRSEEHTSELQSRENIVCRL